MFAISSGVGRRLLTSCGGMTLAVVGMGPTGVSFVWHLIDQLHEERPDRPIRLTIIDPSKEAGAGFAFDSMDRLNMRADRLSIDPRAPTEFVDWLRGGRHQRHYADLEYPPRLLFGQYLRDRFDAAVASADPARVTVEHWRTTAVDLERLDGAFRVTDVRGGTRTFSTVVLATGESRYGALSHHAGRPNFIGSLRETRRIDDVPPDAHVGIVGSSLTAVDVCVRLLGHGHRGAISCFSRTRGLPKVQGATHLHQPALLGPEWLRRVTRSGSRRIPLRAVARAVEHGLNARASGPYQPGMPDPREWFSREGRARRREQDENQIFRNAVAAAENSRTAWYYALDSLSPGTPAIWNAIAEPDQLLFLARCRAGWNEYRHSMPLVNARVLLPAVVSGQLTVRTGFRAVSPTGPIGRRRWRIATRRDAADQVSDVLVDATGGQPLIACQRDRLLAAAIRRGLLVVDPRGGIRVTFDTCRVVTASDGPCPDLHLVGPMTFGTHFYTNSFETNRDNASRVARDIRARLGGARREFVTTTPGDRSHHAAGGS
ncbi:FAD/NAD(P)-binding protein [Plantactinospora sp. WMMB334]|uniref:FAD/NAD(P)-binding protein n=1 Tax=Plantactinospora sp. WMMB334 TaxID=3404119 RepID=UPI003B9465BA